MNVIFFQKNDFFVNFTIFLEDRTALKAILNTYITEDMLNDDFRFSESGDYMSLENMSLE